ncbi:sigma-54-dependent Fis family transcriptional regulator [Pseudomonas syringae pv. tomato]|uniref:Sigma-54-dependent Fis family transcriptional regulator n=1 Tax=Pseudomonas syringae pv. tomato TaxID=323 RepID=A0AB36KT11_PSEUB|nr:MULTISPECIES: sigma 54-interacting transcriptional regulator [Pseudomonas syringae group]MBI6847736.1 sigma 54-interacting transcriptional regulator [Pseudomonas syringae]MBX6506777.1 sigma 54-interacting transcriptional regulator [Pseudomonas syringae pv. tomato]OPE59519.1 sigma-54-dependent Fis family transcriptional regulator [Pseudomonas syringae pv. tomato]RMU99387.1 Sigma-54 dependent transcriptional regulator [Pseudomonas syringae pv. tomato]TES53511.1 AAA family ATPase [Pseudomonas 
MTPQPMAFSVQDLDYLTALDPTSLSEGPIAALENAWLACLSGCTEQPVGVRQVIWDSWHRSVSAGLDPKDGEYRFVNPADLEATLAANRVLIAAAAEVMRGLLAYNPRGHINLTDAAGTTLYFCGLDLTPVGSRLLESVQGTNCTGLALAEDRLLYVLAEENFGNDLRRRRMHCAAAPIRDAQGRTLAMLTLTAEPGWFHFHTLGTVQAAAEAVSRHMALQALLEEQQTVLEVLNEGLVVLDERGCIKALNRYARQLFRVGRDLLGSPFQRLGRSELTDEILLRGGDGLRDLDCTFELHDRSHLACLVSVCSLGQGGRIVSLRENRRIREITRRIVGSQASYTFDTIQGSSRAIQDALHLGRIASRSDSTTLILGESGTGKELFAQAIHNASERCNGPFVAVNCGAIPRDLVQSELFGHVEGAFTGSARGGSAGKFELADGGTIFLDEIGDMSFDAQVSLLRVLQEGEVTRVGAKQSRQVNVRIIAATHRNLSQAVVDGAFREDLYYRLNVLNLTVPPLRMRREDVPVLAQHFLDRCARSLRKSVQGISPEALDMLCAYHWPGNVRELENIIERATNLALTERLQTTDLPLEIKQRLRPSVPGRMPELQAAPDLGTHEMNAIITALKATHGNIRLAAKQLNVSRGGLYNKMNRFGLSADEFRSGPER